MSPSEAIVITGLGVLSPIGIGREAFWKGLEEGRNGIRRLDRFDASDLPCQIAGQLWDFNPEDFMKKSDVRRWHRHVHQALASARLAVEDADFASADYDSERIAGGFGTSVGSPNEAYDDSQEAYRSGGYKKISRFGSSAFSGHSATVHVTINFGIRGPAMTIASGCATGLDVLSWGAEMLRTGRADAALVGATESPVFPMSFASACALGILSKSNEQPHKAMRPFDRNRDGIVLSEGAVAVTLETADRAKARGARIYAEVLGNGSGAEGTHPFEMDRHGSGPAAAIVRALRDACVTPADIDHIQAHGVSLEMYDRTETNAYKSVFGERAYRIPISAIKSMVGQPYAAGGLFGVAGALLALEEGVVAPTVNLDEPDPECDLDYVPREARLNDVETALVVAMSFGGTHSATVLRRYDG